MAVAVGETTTLDEVRDMVEEVTSVVEDEVSDGVAVGVPAAEVVDVTREGGVDVMTVGADGQVPGGVLQVKRPK
jgi:hypothetical protein